MMTHFLRTLTCLVAIFIFQVANSQHQAVSGMRFLNYGANLPKELLSSKTAVLVSVPPMRNEDDQRENWKTIASQAHKTFKDVGIDAVIYFNLENVVAGSEPKRKAIALLNQRKVKNIIVLSHLDLIINGKPERRYAIIMTEYNGKPTFMNDGQSAWKSDHKALEKLLKNVYSTVNKSGLNRTNMLVIDRPEFFREKNILDGQRIADFQADLKLDKLAVPKFKKVSIPSSKPGGFLNGQLEKELKNYNSQVGSKNAKLESIMKSYPFEYGLVDFNGNEQEIRKQGYQYILLHMFTTGHGVRTMLNYPNDEIEEEDYVTTKIKNGKGIIRTIPAQGFVYKFYIKHIHTGDVYVGKSWDADETWHEALENHFVKLKKVVK